jgi:ABC-type glycerol-3-phosphate transport system substrate-binding protein
MSRTRYSAAAVLAAAVLTGVVACGGSGGGSGGGGNGSAATGSGGTIAGASLSISRWAGDPWQTGTQEAATAWATKNKASVKVDAVPYESLQDKQTLQLSSGSGTYDVLYVHPGWFGEYAKAGFLAPIDAYMSDPKLNPDGPASSAYDPNILQQGSYQGKQYCLQDFVSTVLVAYRKDVFAANHLSAPQSTDDIIADAAKLNGKNGMYGITLPGKRTGAVADVVSSLLAGLGTWWYDDAGKASLDAAKAAPAMEFYAKVSKYTPPGLLNFHFDEAGVAAAQGKAAMLIANTPTLARLEDPKQSKTVGKWAYAPLAPGGTPSGELIYWNWCVAKSSKNPRAAYALIRQLTSTQAQVATAAAGATAGATKAFYDDPQATKALPFLPAMTEALKNSKPQPSLPAWAKLQDQIELEVQNVIQGKQTPTQGAQAWLKDLQAGLGG